MAIGITELTFEWSQILNQIGAHFELINSDEYLSDFPNNYNYSFR